MIKELLDGLKSRLKGVGEKGDSLPPAGGLPDMPLEPASTEAPAADESMPPQADASSAEDFSALLGGEATSELDNKVKALEDKTTKIESSLKETLELTKSNASRLDSIDSNMKKFISLYELVTNQINPFVDNKAPLQEAAMEVNGQTITEPGEEEEKIVMPSADELEKEKVAEPAKPVDEAIPTLPKTEPKLPSTKLEKIKPKTDELNEGEQVMFMQSVKDGSASFVLEWITSLVSEDGSIEKNTKLLKYLLELGWITPIAYEALMRHIQALAAAGKLIPAKQQMIPLTVGVPSGSQGMPQPPGQPRPQQLPSMPLTSGSDMDSLMRLLDWVNYLVDKVGYTEAMDILKYLVQLEWITPEAHAALLRYIDKSGSMGSSPASGMDGTPSPLEKTDSKVVLTPNKIPSPADFIAAEYKIPVQSSGMPQAPTQPQPILPGMPYPQQQMPYQQPLQRPVQQKRQPENAIIPLTELGSDIDSLAIVLEWIRYLVDRAGTQGAKDIFGYYLNIGWINQAVNQQLVKYVDGIKASEEETIGYQPTVEDHATSLFFISKLKRMDLSEDDINSILGV